MIRRNLVVVTVLAVLAAVAVSDALAQAGVDLSGTWVLNTELSEDPREEFRRWQQARGVGGAGIPGAGGSPGQGAGGGASDYDGAGGGFGGAGRGAGGGLFGMMERVSQGAERLTIEQNDPEVTITNALGVANMVFADGRLIEREDESGGTTKIKTRWKKDRMIVDIDFPPRPNPTGGTITPGITMNYSLDKNGRLELATSVALGAAVPPFTVERVYDREAPAG